MAFAGMEWIIVIVVIILLLFGAKKIPELARSIGRARAEFSRGQSMVDKEIREAERKDREEEAKIEREEAERKRKEAEEPKASEDTDAGKDEGEVDPEILKAAEALGIEPKGKTEEELKVLIDYKMKQG